MLSIAINRASHVQHVCVTVIIKHNYMLMCNLFHKVAHKHVMFVKISPDICMSRSMLDLPAYEES